MTIAGSGCYNAFEQCPKHYAPPGLHHDVYAEQAQNASTDVEGCLSRARAQWAYCGSYRQYPVTSIFLPTGWYPHFLCTSLILSESGIQEMNMLCR